jgi:hypothetical protein
MEGRLSGRRILSLHLHLYELRGRKLLAFTLLPFWWVLSKHPSAVPQTSGPIVHRSQNSKTPSPSTTHTLTLTLTLTHGLSINKRRVPSVLFVLHYCFFLFNKNKRCLLVAFCNFLSVAQGGFSLFFLPFSTIFMISSSRAHFSFSRP